MTSRNGRPELISLLQYMKNTTLHNKNILVQDPRILKLDRIVTEVKQSEEWEAVKMNILEIGLQQGMEQGLEQGREQGLEQDLEKGREQGLEQGLEKGIKALIETCQELKISKENTFIRPHKLEFIYVVDIRASNQSILLSGLLYPTEFQYYPHLRLNAS